MANGAIKRDKIIIKGARVNNLKNIDVDIPRDKFVVITGLSGSGKSSLAFDTVFAEGNRRYMESLSSYARNFLDVAAKPDVDKIENLCPSIAIDQKSIARSPRSTVGTLTEIYDYLRILFAKIGIIYCPKCGALMQRKTNREILQDLGNLPERTQIAILSKLSAKTKEEKNSQEILKQIQQLGFARIRVNKKMMTIPEAMAIADNNLANQTEIVIDRIIITKKDLDEERLLDSIETAMKVGDGSMAALIDNETEKSFNRDFLCSRCDIHIKEISPRHFSFNNPEGACPSCSGLGIKLKIKPELVIPNENLSLAEGAVQPWSKCEGKISTSHSYLALLETLSREFKFSLNVPIKKLSAWHKNLILYGTEKADRESGISPRTKGLSPNNFGVGINNFSFSFEGVIPGLERKYKETKSDYVRNEIEKYMIIEECPDCKGKRLKREFLSVLVNGKSIDDLATMDISQIKKFFEEFNFKDHSEEEKEIIRPIVKEIIKRLLSLENVGLEYLNLARSSQTLSGGEAQRIRLAVQINSQLMGIVYVLDEPSIGLHSRDTEKLVRTIRSLRDAGNSLIIVGT